LVSPRKETVVTRLQCAILAVTVACPGPAWEAEETKKTVPTYTNEDLARMAPFRDQTGVMSKPAVPPARPAARRRSGSSAGRGEAYWRREAERVRNRIRPLQERAEELARKIDERRRQPGVRPYTDPKLVAWQRQREALCRRIDQIESRFEERARRQRALPGWLR
jgi:hypothetical protein